MSAKDNFAQAMKELLNTGENEATTNEEDKKVESSSFSSFSQPESRPPRAPAPEKQVEAQEEAIAEEPPQESKQADVAQDEPAEETSPAQNLAAEGEKPVTGSLFGGSQSFQSGMASSTSAASSTSTESGTGTQSASPFAQVPAETGKTTVIAAGTVLIGNISTSGGLRIDGDIKGNVQVATNVELNGKVIGDIEAADAVIKNSKVRGNISVSNSLNMDKNTIVVGDVSADNVKIDGKIKGNLSVDDRGHFETNFVLVGNLVAGTVVIDEGAMLKGDIAITNEQTEDINVEEPEFEINI